MAIELGALWDFSKPEVSEQRFREALTSAVGDDVVILKTQIARTFGLRKDFVRARAILAECEGAAQRAGPEARARHALELGRTEVSATHPPESITQESKARARSAYFDALAAARAGGLDGLAIDAIHMLAFVDTAPADQLKWNREALAVVEASSQPAAKRWEASVRNNLGMALHDAGRRGEALEQFERALSVRELGSDAEATRVARWMVAWTLRTLGRTDEAFAIQRRLEGEYDAAGKADPHVYEELEHLYRARGDSGRADAYSARAASLKR